MNTKKNEKKTPVTGSIHNLISAIGRQMCEEWLYVGPSRMKPTNPSMSCVVTKTVTNPIQILLFIVFFLSVEKNG